MSEEFDLDEFLSDDTKAAQVEGSKLREVIKRLNAEKAALATQLSEAQAAQNAAAIEKLEIPASLYATYTGEKTPEKVAAWWEALKPFVNVEAAVKTPAETQEQIDQRAALDAVQQAAQLGTPQGLGGYEAAEQAAADLRSKVLSGAATKADTDAFWRAQGIPTH